MNVRRSQFFAIYSYHFGLRRVSLHAGHLRQEGLLCSMKSMASLLEPFHSLASPAARDRHSQHRRQASNWH